MELRVGVTDTHKELLIELEERAKREKLVAEIEKSLSDGEGMMWFTDKRGRTVGVPSAKVAYIELSAEDERRVGFGVT